MPTKMERYDQKIVLLRRLTRTRHLYKEDEILLLPDAFSSSSSFFSVKKSIFIWIPGIRRTLFWEHFLSLFSACWSKVKEQKSHLLLIA